MWATGVGMKNHQMSGLEWGLLLLLAGLWGGSFLFNEIALREMAPLSVVVWRVGCGAAVLWLVVLLGGYDVPRDIGVWGGFVVLGALNNALPFFLIVWGQARIDSGLAAILNATTPMFGLVLAHFLTTDERITALRALGLGFGLAGVVVLVGPSALTNASSALFGQLALLGAGVSYALAGIYGKRLTKTPPVVLAAAMLTAATGFAALAGLVADGGIDVPRAPASWAAVFGLAVPGAAVAYVVYYRLLASAGATNLLLVTLLIPFAAVALGVVFLQEVITPAIAAGFALVLAGLAVIDGRAVDVTRRAARRQTVRPRS